MDEIYHNEFVYIYIPVDINSQVEELKFKGLEKEFRERLIKHFSIHSLLPSEIEQLHNQYSKETNGDHKDLISECISSSNTYQIIPLTLPSKKNGFEGINCYIDNVGRVKGLPQNARATRICSTDIRGDCFICLTFDDEEVFKRINFGINDYKKLMDNPPDPTKRWDPSKALSMLNDPNKQINSLLDKKKVEDQNYCENCRKEFNKNDRFFKCSRCSKVKYCGQECQKSDWEFHKNICIRKL